MKLVIVFLAAALLLLNCKKSRITPVTDITPVAAKQPATILTDHGETFNLLYDEHGQLLVHTTGTAVYYYKPGSDHFLTELLKETNKKIIYKHAQRDVHNRIIQLEKFSADVAEATIEFTYNSDGFLSKRKLSVEGSGIVQEFIYTYDAGNLVKIEEYEDAVLKSTLLMEYDNNRFNSVAIDLFDFKQIGFITDAQFGKQSKNLVKSIKAVIPNEQVGIAFQYIYKTDADGYVKSMEIETSNEAIRKYNFIFQ
ncbi:hypothetical protein [Lacibacter sp. H407]|uniref:hypothetical protein n=1 Tax=Lacibacter sp. H407 TaxID=3133423 RepID=UPI0030C447A7